MAKRFLLTAVVAAVLISSVWAGEAVQAPETKRIGVVYIQQVFKEYQFAKDSEVKIKTTFEPDQRRIEAEVQKIQEMEKNLQNDPMKPQGSPAFQKAMMEIEMAKIEARRMQEDFIKRMREAEFTFWQQMYQAFQRSCRLYAEHYGYDVIIASPDSALSEEVTKAMDPMGIQQEILMRRIQYVSDRANLTKPITDLMNHRYQQNLKNPQANPL